MYLWIIPVQIPISIQKYFLCLTFFNPTAKYNLLLINFCCTLLSNKSQVSGHPPGLNKGVYVDLMELLRLSQIKKFSAPQFTSLQRPEKELIMVSMPMCYTSISNNELPFSIFLLKSSYILYLCNMHLSSGQSSLSYWKIHALYF